MPTDWESRLRDLAAGADNARRLLRAFRAGQPAVQQPQLPTPDLLEILRRLPNSIGYLKSRRTRPFASIESEDDLQDLLWLTLKPHFPDLEYESPTRKSAASYAICDFALPSLSMLLEAKFIAATKDVKRVADEISEDIWKYSTTTDYGTFVFFVYDPDILIPDREKFIEGLSSPDGEYQARGRAVTIHTLIVP